MVTVGGVIVLGLIFVLGLSSMWLLEDRLDARLPVGWRWLRWPVVATVSFGGFLVLQLLVVDQPRTPMWLVLGVLGVALLAAGASAVGYGIVAAGAWFASVL